MSARIVRVAAKNFLSFAEMDIPLSGRGLVLVEGDNRDGFSSNGAGKSSLLEAVLYGVYGTTTKGLPKSDLIRRGAEGNAYVEVEFVTAKRHYVVRRAMSGRARPLSFEVDGDDITEAIPQATQARIDAAMGCGVKTFLSAFFFGQESLVRFARGTDAEQKEVMEAILGIERYKAASRRAGEKRRAAEAQASAIDTELAWVRESVAKISARLGTLRGEAHSAQKKAKAEIAGIDREIRAGTLRRGEIMADILALEQKRNRVENALAECKASLASLADQIGFAQGQRAELEARLREKKDAVEQARSLHKETSCPTCRQPIQPGRMNAVLRDLISQQGECDAALSRTRDAISVAAKEADGWRRKIAAKEEVFEKARRAASKLLGEDAQLLGSLERLCEHRESVYGANYAELIRQAEEELKDIEERLAVLKAKRARWAELAETMEFWERGFGREGIPHRIMSAALPQLNSEVRRMLSRLGAASKFDVSLEGSRSLKSGETRERFSLCVDAANAGPTYSSLSGGEKRRVDLAMLLALQSLARERSGASPGIVFMDEVFAELDAEGCEAVTALLEEEAARIGTILVVTHQQELRDYFDGDVISVVKEKGISRIQ